MSCDKIESGVPSFAKKFTSFRTHLMAPRALRPFAHRDYRVLLIAMAISVFAHGMWAVAMVYQVKHLGGGPAQLSIVATATSIGLLGFVLIGGITADRVSCRKIIITVEALSLLVMSTVAVPTSNSVGHSARRNTSITDCP